EVGRALVREEGRRRDDGAVAQRERWVDLGERTDPLLRREVDAEAELPRLGLEREEDAPRLELLVRPVAAPGVAEDELARVRRRARETDDLVEPEDAPVVGVEGIDGAHGPARSEPVLGGGVDVARDGREDAVARGGDGGRGRDVDAPLERSHPAD